jgi:hypothetical protein
MFGRTTDDIARTLTQMIEEARVACRHNQNEMARTIGGWLGQDRRFDGVGDKVSFAADAMDAKSHGRQIDLTEQRVTVGDTAYGRTAPIGGLASVLRNARSR